MKRGLVQEPLVVFLLSFVTCSIYWFFWLFRVDSELNAALEREEFNTGLDILLVIVTCGVWVFFVHYKHARAINELQAKVGLPVSSDLAILAIVMTLIGFLGLLAPAILQNELNRVWKHEQGKAGLP